MILKARKIEGKEEYVCNSFNIKLICFIRIPSK